MSLTLTRRALAVLAAASLTAGVLGTATALAASSSGQPKSSAAYGKWAKKYGLKGAAAGIARDGDRDGLKNWGEFRSGTSPKDKDSDDDRVSDALEDRDHDCITNVAEQTLKTDPRSDDDLDEFESAEIECKGTVVSFTAPSASTAGTLLITRAGATTPSTLNIPAGATVIGGDVLVAGKFVEVEIETEHGTTVLEAHLEDTGPSGSDDSDGSGSSGKGGGGKDDSSDD